jgi:hypothetical protein
LNGERIVRRAVPVLEKLPLLLKCNCGYGYGAKPGSDAYVSCRMNIDNQRAAADNVNRAIVGQYLLTHR